MGRRNASLFLSPDLVIVALGIDWVSVEYYLGVFSSKALGSFGIKPLFLADKRKDVCSNFSQRKKRTVDACVKCLLN